MPANDLHTVATVAHGLDNLVASADGQTMNDNSINTMTALGRVLSAA